MDERPRARTELPPVLSFVLAGLMIAVGAFFIVSDHRTVLDDLTAAAWLFPAAVWFRKGMRKQRSQQ